MSAPTSPAVTATVVQNAGTPPTDAAVASRVSVTNTAPLDARVVASHAAARDDASTVSDHRAQGADIDAATPRAVGAAAPPDTAVAVAADAPDISATVDAAGAGTAGGAAVDADVVLPREPEQRREPVLSPIEPDPQSPATTVSNLPPVVVDRRIDCIIELEPGETVSGERIIPLAIRFRRAGSKPVYVEGRDQDGHWGTLRPGNQYGKLRAAVQLANRAGPLNELEFSEFVGGVHRLADALDAAAEFPDMTEVVQMARELDGFAAQCDAQLSVNVLSDNAPWSGSYVQAVASQDGLLLSRDGTRFVKLDAQQNPVFTLTFEGTNFLRDDLTYKGGHMITLLLDVPVADEDILPWRLMCDYARSLAQRIGARVVDDQRRVLPDASLQAIDERLMTLYARLETAGIPAGSAAARRLFSS
ncbi:cell division protein ZipA C-terminal FtsZ-binding domain-containing protein [Robbsia betulipollinis]|uniref:cell division protein ZipA C-terminal FtsZ-binding domain-containing protein n=1 Tax=Robbsia betulipollinis TaxID=2981849 RepID=UPI003D7B90C5